jgi:spermidine synthase
MRVPCGIRVAAWRCRTVQNEAALIPLQLLDTAELPDGGTLRLMYRGEDFSILFGRNELMSSRVRGSEEALATLACEHIECRTGPRMLIGGLGMGFTLRAALNALPPTATIIVAELVPKILAWAEGPLAHLFGDSLSDPRLSIEIRDVHECFDAPGVGYDAILLDVDNGPDGLIHAANDRLYGVRGLRAAASALRPGGILAIWSAYPDTAFVERLQRAGFSVDERRVRATGGRKGAHHIVWLAVKTG